MREFSFKIGKYTFSNKINFLNEKPFLAIRSDITLEDGRVTQRLLCEVNHHNLIHLLKNPLGYCGACQRYYVYPNRYHRNTAYVEAECNYGYMCKDCQKEEHAQYQELWNDYYASRF